MIRFLGFMFTVAMLEMSIESFINKSAYALHNTLSEVCVEQRLEALVYVHDEAHITKFSHIILLC